MDFGGFLGNSGLKQRLSTAVAGNRLSHCYLLTGPEGSGKKTLAKWLAAAMQCTSSVARPCFSCPQCRKVLADAHPDVVVTDDEDKAFVSVDTVRRAKTDLYIRPNEGNKKIYLFPRAGLLRIEAQNALLKVMEEPPAYGAFLLLAERAESLLPTIRSRCVELSLSPVDWAEALPYLQREFPQKNEQTLEAAWRRGGGFLGQAKQILETGGEPDGRAEALADAFADGDRLSLCRTLCKMEKLKRDQLIPILRQLRQITAEALSAKSGAAAVTAAAQHLAAKKTAAVLMQVYRDLSEMLVAAERNVGVGHICGILAVRLR